jgi:hypothetical protein
MPAEGMCAARKNEFQKEAFGPPKLAAQHKHTPSPVRHQWGNTFSISRGTRAAAKLLTRDEARRDTRR